MATPDEDEVLMGHYLKIWDGYGTPPEHYKGRTLVSRSRRLRTVVR